MPDFEEVDEFRRIFGLAPMNPQLRFFRYGTRRYVGYNRACVPIIDAESIIVLTESFNAHYVVDWRERRASIRYASNRSRELGKQEWQEKT